ncbi:hypothetical protein B566_EDAN013997 [Ephemera danica]|nr:hypothetical protein B566_EDAN013997 [Ephemera danica]
MELYRLVYYSFFNEKQCKVPGNVCIYVRNLLLRCISDAALVELHIALGKRLWRMQCFYWMKKTVWFSWSHDPRREERFKFLGVVKKSTHYFATPITADAQHSRHQ